LYRSYCSGKIIRLGLGAELTDAVDGKKVDSPNDLSLILENCQIGDIVH
jgi:hypothetical protein